MPRYSGPHQEGYEEMDEPARSSGKFWLIFVTVILALILCAWGTVVFYTGEPAPGPIGVSRTPDPPL